MPGPRPPARGSTCPGAAAERSPLPGPPGQGPQSGRGFTGESSSLRWKPSPLPAESLLPSLSRPVSPISLRGDMWGETGTAQTAMWGCQPIEGTRSPAWKKPLRSADSWRSDQGLPALTPHLTGAGEGTGSWREGEEGRVRRSKGDAVRCGDGPGRGSGPHRGRGHAEVTSHLRMGAQLKWRGLWANGWGSRWGLAPSQLQPRWAHTHSLMQSAPGCADGSLEPTLDVGPEGRGSWQARIPRSQGQVWRMLAPH